MLPAQIPLPIRSMDRSTRPSVLKPRVSVLSVRLQLSMLTGGGRLISLTVKVFISDRSLPAMR